MPPSVIGGLKRRGVLLLLAVLPDGPMAVDLSFQPPGRTGWEVGAPKRGGRPKTA
jgi:hypothetical protein